MYNLFIVLCIFSSLHLNPLTRSIFVHSNDPTPLPTSSPSSHPSGQPSYQPSMNPSCQPSSEPSTQPTTEPSSPSSQPTSTPSESRKPTSQPSMNPSLVPTGQPTTMPSFSQDPSSQPSGQPSGLPSMQPTTIPTGQPSLQPTVAPSSPTGQPSANPSAHPLSLPSSAPSMQPSSTPTAPTSQPSMQPSKTPSGQPSVGPFALPSSQPSRMPTSQPTTMPTLTYRPTPIPTTALPVPVPSSQPSSTPTISSKPTPNPVSVIPSSQPSVQPSMYPSNQPTCTPSSRPSTQPSMHPSSPSSQPTTRPTSPSGQPTSTPSSQPSVQPSIRPSAQPASYPSSQPSAQPSFSPFYPTSQPTRRPTMSPTAIPTPVPTTAQPSVPTSQPSTEPTSPTSSPSSSREPTRTFSRKPTIAPTQQPTYTVTASPSYLYEKVTTSGVVSFYQDGNPDDVCDPVQVEINVTFHNYLGAGSTFTVGTPGLTSGECYTPTNGFDINSIVIPTFTPAALWLNAQFIEGHWNNSFYDSRLIFTLVEDITAGMYLEIIIDRTNRLRRTCSSNSTWPVSVSVVNEESNTGITGYLARNESTNRKCFIYSSSLVFTQPHQQFPTGMNVTLHVPFDVTRDTMVTIQMPGFTNKLGAYAMNTLTNGDLGDIGLGTNAALQCLRWSSPSGWAGNWFEGSLTAGNGYTGAYIELYSTGSNPFGSQAFWIYIDRSCNNIIPVCGREYSSVDLSVTVNSTLYFTATSPPSYSSAIGRGCDLFNACSGNGNCNFCTSKCSCYEGWGSATDKQKAGPQATSFTPDCASRACPSGPSWISLLEYRNLTEEDFSFKNRTLWHQDVECSANGICDRSSGVCKCRTPFGGKACERMTCPGTPACNNRGICQSMTRLARNAHALPLSVEAGAIDAVISAIRITKHNFQNSIIEYDALTSVNQSYTSTWDANMGSMCVCDSAWDVGLSVNQTQLSEWFGPSCEFRRCPSGNDPTTAEDETDCNGKAQTGGRDTGQPGNKCHVDCSNKGICDHHSGVCACFDGYKGIACDNRLSYEVPDSRRPRSDRFLNKYT